MTYSIALLGMGALLLALTAIYTRESAVLGRLGLIGYLTAFLGTLMVAGDWWFEAFVVPMIATAAPAVLDLPLSGSVLVGAIATVGLYTVGWTVFGIAALRARAFPRAAALLLLAGGLAGPRPVDAVPDPAGDRDRLDRPHLESESDRRTQPRSPHRHGPRLTEQRYSHEALTAHRHPFPCGSGLRHRVGGARIHVAAADDGPDLAAIDRYVRSEMDAQRIPAWRSASCTGTASCTCRASDRRTGPDGR